MKQKSTSIGVTERTKQKLALICGYTREKQNDVLDRLLTPELDRLEKEYRDNQERARA